MKKFSWIMALLAALALVFVGVGCGGDGDGGDVIEYDITPLTLVQVDLPGGIPDVPEAEKALGKGYVIGEQFAAVKAAPAGSFIRVTLTGTENLNWDSIGAVGIGDMGNSTGNRCDFAPKSGGTYTVDTPTANVFALTGAATAVAVSVNSWGNHKIDKAELYVPQEEVFVEVADITGIESIVNSPSYELVGTVLPADAKNKTIAWTLKSGDAATLATDTLTFTKEGKVTVTATIVDGKKNGNFTKDFEIEYVDLPVLTKSIYVGNQTPIGFAGMDGDLAWTLFTESKFIVFAFKGGLQKLDGSNQPLDPPEVNLDGFGGLQIAMQYDGDTTGIDWNQYETPGWTNNGTLTGRTADEFIFYVFPFTSIPEITEARASTKAKIILNSGFTPFYVGAWLTSETLNSTGGEMHGDGWFIRQADLGL